MLQIVCRRCRRTRADPRDRFDRARESREPERRAETERERERVCSIPQHQYIVDSSIDERAGLMLLGCQGTGAGASSAFFFAENAWIQVYNTFKK